jgi:hypothetical protein
MNDPRLDEGHLDSPRREEYQQARAEMLASMGSATMDVERAILELGWPLKWAGAPDGYALRKVTDGKTYRLRLGVNTIGRSPQNDIVLGNGPISRRHCVILVHATGGCEVHDTASRNGIWVNDRRVDRAPLLPGDSLFLPECR